MAATFWLGSNEITSWSSPRVVVLQEPALERDGHRAYWADVDPPSPGGRRRLVIAARYPGKTVDPPASLPVVVDLWVPRDASVDGGRIALEELELAGVGELYETREDAEATTGGW